MPGRFLIASERKRFNNFLTDIPDDDRVAFFTLSEQDLQQVRQHRGDHNQLGFALQRGALRYMGFCPDELLTAPFSVIASVADQIGVASPVETLTAYQKRKQTRTDHLLLLQRSLGYRKATPDDLTALSTWLRERALEHDTPTLLFQLAGERLRAQKIVRPGVTSLERMVVTVRQQAQEDTLPPSAWSPHRPAESRSGYAADS
jgi:hypothetical protein